ncbi:hypothetical protein ACKKBG_A21475 [Auxenochlorella protothecoides x Auxenochlorella symbiontica]
MGVLDAWSNSGAKYGDDLESGGGLLYPGIDATDNSLRWGFVRKVYGIVTIQLALTAAVALVVTLVPSVNAFLARSLAANIGLMVLSLLALIPLFIYKDRHPLNLALLGLWTLAALTAYSFWATARGVDFSPVGPLLAGLLWAMLAWGLFQIFFHPGPVARTIFSLLGALLFSAYLVFDTQLLIQRVGLDEYIWASVMIYLDVLNLFLYILRLLGDRRD